MVRVGGGAGLQLKPVPSSPCAPVLGPIQQLTQQPRRTTILIPANSTPSRTSWCQVLQLKPDTQVLFSTTPARRTLFLTLDFGLRMTAQYDFIAPAGLIVPTPKKSIETAALIWA